MEELLKSVSSSFMPGLMIVAMLMPFWYACLYLFHRSFFEKSKEVLKWVFAFCLSFSWYILFVLFIALMPYFNVTDNAVSNPAVPLIAGKIQSFYFLTGGNSILALILVMGFTYNRFRSKPKDFFPLLKSIYGTIIILWVVIAIIALILGESPYAVFKII